MGLQRNPLAYCRPSNVVACLCLLALIGLYAAPPAIAGPARVGEIIGQSGQATVERVNGTVGLAIGAAVYESDRIVTGPDGRIKVRFKDGTIVAVSNDSELVVADYVTDKDRDRVGAVLSLLLGILRATVAGGGAQGGFEIETRIAVASVRSTDFMVEAKGGHAAVVVLDGTVEVAGAGTGSTVILEPGEGTDVEAGAPPGTPKRWGQARVDAFLARTAVP
jgi:hypothetical protein